MGKIKVGIIGVGNCFSGLAQGIEYYKRNPKREVTGIMHERIGGYSIHDIEFVCGFDVAENKVGKPLAEAIYASPNEVRWVDSVSNCPGNVLESPVLDGIGIYMQNRIVPVKSTKTGEQLKKEAVAEIKRSGARILLNYLPVGSQKATEFWADVALEAGCAFVNNMPVFIASDKGWARKFAERKLPVVGDDIKSQLGSTIVHRVMAKLCVDRGVEIDKTYQINVGGNTDFITMLERDRLESKKISKTEAVQSQLKKRLPDDRIYVGPSDFIPFLGNTKLAFIRLEGKMFADVPYNLEMRLEVDDKANSGGTTIEAIRCCQLALDRGLGGEINSAS
ncbi:MAG TPA: inositol-3-phosphate synthase, partial [Candidatus Bilamarchaeaceae archaeon]|nr:inositol-3-phosphate synthase [Candidatus Bilamarchaeaceae archaeon]